MNEAHQTLLQQIGRTARAMHAAFESEVGQSLPRWRLLQALYDHASLSQKQLAEIVVVDPGALTRFMKQMEAEGLVRRSVDAGDNRLTNVELTPAGRALVDAAQARRLEFHRRALADFPEAQLDVAQTLLTQLEARFRAMGRPD